MADKLLAEWFWVDRWMGSSAFLLPMEARGIYREMLSQAWRRGAQLPSDPEMIQRAIGCSREEWDRNWKRLSRYWIVTGDVMVNETQVAVYQECLKQRERASDHARKAALARYSREEPEDMPEQMPGVCPPAPAPTLDQTPHQTPKKKKPSSEASAPDAECLLLATRLRNLILANKPDAKVPSVLTEWGHDIRRLRDIDHRAPEQIAAVIDWCQADDFWWRNILSAGTLRKQWDKLTAKMGGSNGHKSGSGKSTAHEKASTTPISNNPEFWNEQERLADAERSKRQADAHILHPRPE